MANDLARCLRDRVVTVLVKAFNDRSFSGTGPPGEEEIVRLFPCFVHFLAPVAEKARMAIGYDTDSYVVIPVFQAHIRYLPDIGLR